MLKIQSDAIRIYMWRRKISTCRFRNGLKLVAWITTLSKKKKTVCIVWNYFHMQTFFLLKIIYRWKGSSNMFHTSCIKHLLLLPKGGPATVTRVRIKVKCENEWKMLISALRLDLHVALDFYPSISSCF